MRLIACLDAVATLAMLVGLVVLIVSRRCKPWRGAGLILLGLMIFFLLYSLCMWAEWAGFSHGKLERWEDFWGSMVPMWWAFLLYALAQDVIMHDLHRSQERLNQALDATDTGVWDYYPQAGRVYYGPRWFGILGYSPDELPSTPETWLSLLHPNDIETARENLKGFVAGDQDLYHSIFRMRTKEGGWRWIDSQGKAVQRDTAGKVARLIGTHTDITARMMAEKELQAHREHLEELVDQRTQELHAAQDQLIRSERLATLGQLTATVAHEIRNPLGTIRNSVFSIGDAIAREQPERATRSLTMADRNIKRCDRIIQDLLDFSRKRELHFNVIDFDAWLLNLINEISVPEGVELSHTLSASVQASFDCEHLRRALVNVIQNAFQALEDPSQGQRHVHVTTQATDQGLEIQVMDTGPGIPEEIMEKIFKPLFSTKTFGVGLGVPIIKSIMEEHGGRVHYSSHVGQGTTVTLYLPLNIQEGETI